MVGRLIQRFCRDDRGVFAVTFGLIAIVLTAMAGATVDLVTVDQVRNRVQIALDSAALALQPEIYSKSDDELKVAALALVRERVGDKSVKVEMGTSDVSTDTENGRLYLQAHVSVPLAFVALLGINQMDVAVASQVTRKKLALEVAMVLDNSGSMSAENRITNLISAAKCATWILFYDACKAPSSGAVKDPHTKVAVVPFTFFVRPVTGYSSSLATWVDKGGDGSIANDNIDTDDDDSKQTLTSVDRIALIESMGQNWKGCFEARKYPNNVNDVEPNIYDPETMFTPEFAPDEPGAAGYPDADFNNSYVDDNSNNCPVPPSVVVTSTKTGCSSDASGDAWWAYEYCYSTPSTTYLLTHSNGSTSTAPVSPVPSSLDGFSLTSTTNSYKGTKVGKKYNYTYTNTLTQTYSYQPNLSNREKQERFCKYKGATVHSAYDSAKHEPYTQGPNAGCPDAAIQPLTDNVTSIINEISAMKADGGTNIAEGAAWGYRVLSPTAPFTEGEDYNSGASKVIILMTDGENTYWNVNRRRPYSDTASPNINGTYYYTAYGYQYNDKDPDGSRLSVNGNGAPPYSNYDYDSLQRKMNELTEQSCANAKKDGITIYTVGLKPPNQTTIDMLTNCASDAKKAYFPTDPTQLNDVFSAIASELSQLRIEK